MGAVGEGEKEWMLLKPTSGIDSGGIILKVNAIWPCFCRCNLYEGGGSHLPSQAASWTDIPFGNINQLRLFPKSASRIWGTFQTMPWEEGLSAGKRRLSGIMITGGSSSFRPPKWNGSSNHYHLWVLLHCQALYQVLLLHCLPYPYSTPLKRHQTYYIVTLNVLIWQMRNQGTK